MRGQARNIITVQQLWAIVFPALRQGMVELGEDAFIFGLWTKLLEQNLHIVSDLLAIELLPLDFGIGTRRITQTSGYFA